MQKLIFVMLIAAVLEATLVHGEYIFRTVRFTPSRDHKHLAGSLYLKRLHLFFPILL